GEGREATGDKAVPRALGWGPPGHRIRALRLGLTACALILLVCLGGAQAAMAEADPVLEKAEPNAGCPGTTVTLTGKNFGGPGFGTAVFRAKVFPLQSRVPATITSGTTAMTTVPIFLTNGNEAGSVSLTDSDHESSNRLPF